MYEWPLCGNCTSYNIVKSLTGCEGTRRTLVWKRELVYILVSFIFNTYFLHFIILFISGKIRTLVIVLKHKILESLINLIHPLDYFQYLEHGKVNRLTKVQNWNGKSIYQGVNWLNSFKFKILFWQNQCKLIDILG